MKNRILFTMAIFSIFGGTALAVAMLIAISPLVGTRQEELIVYGMAAGIGLWIGLTAIFHGFDLLWEMHDNRTKHNAG